MNTELGKNAQNDFKKIFLSSWTIQFLEKLWKMWKKHRGIELITTEVRKNYLVSEPN